MARQAQLEHQSRERQLEEQIQALRHRLSGEVARFSAAAEAMQLAAVQEQQSLGEEMEASQRKWQADISRAAERLSAAQTKVQALMCSCSCVPDAAVCAGFVSEPCGVGSGRLPAWSDSRPERVSAQWQSA